MVVRDHAGVFVAAECRRYKNINNPCTVEGSTSMLRLGSHACAIERVNSSCGLVVETDCQLIVKAWDNEKTQRSTADQILRETKLSLRGKLIKRQSCLC